MSKMNAQFNCPFNMIISGPTSSGKSVAMKNILKFKNEMLTNPPSSVVIFFKIWQPLYDELKEGGLVTHFYEGVPDEEFIFPFLEERKGSYPLIIFDDLLSEINHVIEKLFLVGSHHLNTSIILLTQHLFYANPLFRTLSLNATYLLVKKNPRDPSQMVILNKQLFPGKRGFLTRIFETECAK